jgi:anti-sigma regulatory factor (Ser/Thr protein kinase)
MRPRVVEFAFNIPATPFAVTVARHLIAQVVDLVDADSLAVDACIVTSELVANAVRYADDEVKVRCRIDEDRFLVEVDDDARGEPQVENPDPDTERGRGLLIVSRLSTAWGWQPAPDGKSVWAELRLPSRSAPVMAN